MRVAVTGAGGFIGRNLMLALNEHPDLDPLPVSRDFEARELAAILPDIDAVIHLAGVNRPSDPAEFSTGNIDFTERLCNAIEMATVTPVLIYASSAQATTETPYGISKRRAEDRLQRTAAKVGASLYIYRFPNVFGKWARPNYNSAIATFCHNIAHGIPIDVHNGDAPLSLLYIDDLIRLLIDILLAPPVVAMPMPVPNVFSTTVGEVVALIRSFEENRRRFFIEPTEDGLVRALYSTFVSYLPEEAFSYPLVGHRDARGIFAEAFRSQSSGQVSVLTAHPGVTRGGHYHHTKVEKFLVVRGRARFRFRDLASGRRVEIDTDGDDLRIVETIPGWTHDITNIGNDEMIAMLWASELFDPQRPDTHAHAL